MPTVGFSLQTSPSLLLPSTGLASFLHLFDDPEYCGTLQGVIGNAHSPEREAFLIRVRVFSAYGRPHPVNRAAVVVAEKRAQLLASLVRAVVLIGFQVRLDEFGSRHIQMPGDPLDVLIIELDAHSLAAVGAASAIHDPEGSLMQLTGKLV